MHSIFIKAWEFFFPPKFGTVYLYANMPKGQSPSKARKNKMKRGK